MSILKNIQIFQHSSDVRHTRSCCFVCRFLTACVCGDLGFTYSPFFILFDSEIQSCPFYWSYTGAFSNHKRATLHPGSHLSSLPAEVTSFAMAQLIRLTRSKGDRVPAVIHLGRLCEKGADVFPPPYRTLFSSHRPRSVTHFIQISLPNHSAIY